MDEDDAPIGHAILSYAAHGSDWQIKCECGWYTRETPIDPAEPPSGLMYDYRSHLDDVLEPKEEQPFERRKPRGPLEIRCPACKGYGYVPPTPLDVTKYMCHTCNGSGTVRAAVVPHAVAAILPADVDYLEVQMNGKVIPRRLG